MEFKVWADGVQRIVCGVTVDTTCQQIVVALAQALGQTGRFSLLERWRHSERLVPPDERPALNLQQWGELCHEVIYLLRNNSSPGSALMQTDLSPPPQSHHHAIRKRLTFSGAPLSSSEASPANSEASSSAGNRRRIFYNKRPHRQKPKSPPPYDIAVARARLMNKQKGANVPATLEQNGPVCNGTVLGAAELPTKQQPPNETDSLMKLIAVQLRKMEILESQIDQVEKEIKVVDSPSRNQPSLDKGQFDTLLDEMKHNESEITTLDASKMIDVLEASQQNGQELSKGLTDLRTKLRSNDRTLLDLQTQIQTLEVRVKSELTVVIEEQQQNNHDDEFPPPPPNHFDLELKNLEDELNRKTKLLSENEEQLEGAVNGNNNHSPSSSPLVANKNKRKISGYWV